MDSKKRIRGAEGSELDPTDVKRIKSSHGHNLHDVQPEGPKSLEKISKSALEDLLMDIDDSEPFTLESSVQPPSSSVASPVLHKSIETASNRISHSTQNAIAELLDGIEDAEEESEPFSISETSTVLVPSNPSSSGSLSSHIQGSATASLFSKASRTAPLHKATPSPQPLHSPSIVLPSNSDSEPIASSNDQPNVSNSKSSLFQVASSKPFVFPAIVNSTVIDEPPMLLPLGSTHEDRNEEFEAILEAARRKKVQQPVRQLHHPKSADSPSLPMPPTRHNASNPSTSLFSSARSIRDEAATSTASPTFELQTLSSVSASNEDDEFENMMANIKSKGKPTTFNAPSNAFTSPKSNHLGAPAPAPSSSSLFQSARSISPSISQDAPLAASTSGSSLFQTASREVSGSTSSLFSSARNLRDESTSPQVSSSSSLFSTAKNIRDEENGASTSPLFQVASAHDSGATTSASLFSIARNLYDDAASGPDIPLTSTSGNDDEQDFERYLSTIRSKRDSSTFSAPRPLHQISSNSRQNGAARPSTTSLFQSANSLPTSESSSNVIPTTRVISPIPESATAAAADDEDDLDAFLNSIAKRKNAAAPAPINISSAKRTSSPASSAVQSRATAAPNPRKFKAPAILSPSLNRAATSNSAETKAADDEVQDALLSLLDDNDNSDSDQEGSSTPKPSYKPLPKSPTILNRPKKVLISPLSTRDRSSEDMDVDPSSTATTTASAPHVAQDFSELLEGLESEEMEFSVPSTPQSSSNRRFYASPSKTPSTPSSSNPSSRPGISNRGIVRSSPYSLTSPNAMPIVVSTPTKLVEVRSPTRLPRSTPSPLPTPNSSSKRARAPFTSPTRQFDDGVENDENPEKRSKQVVYGRNTGSSSESAPKKSIKQSANSLFNLNPTEEQLAQRQPWSAVGRAPHAFSHSQLRAYKLRPDVVSMTSDSAKTFKFEHMDSDGVLKQLGADEMFEVLLSEGASRKVLTRPWLANHYRWIIWKLASVERSFPQEFANAYLTPERTLAQLKYRYERELNCAQRPPLRKILEHDAPAGVHLVLMVSAIRHDGMANQAMRVTGDHGPQNFDEEEDANRVVKGPLAILEVSDGWYGVNALCDPYLTRLVQDGGIFVGQKLHIFGASIIGNDNPTPPLEVTASTMLKLNMNGVKRAKWDEKLGFSRVPLPSVRISSLKPGGGNASKIDAIILRVYPLSFSEEVVVTPVDDENAKRGPDGELSPVMRVTRTPYGEDIALERFIKKKEDWMEKKTRELIMEILEESKSIAGKASARILMEENSDQNGNGASENARYYDETYLTNAQREKLDEKLREAMESEPWLDRQVTPILRLLICDYPGAKGTAFEVIEHLKENGADGLMTMTSAQSKALHSLGKAMLTVYNVTEDALARFKEGTRIQASFVSYKGEPHVPPRPLPSELLPPAMDIPEPDNELLNQSKEAPLARLSTTVYTVFNFPTNSKSSNRNADGTKAINAGINILEGGRSTQNGDSVVKTLTALFGRVATPFDALFSRLRLREVPAPDNTYDINMAMEYERRRLVDRFTISNEFDAVGVIVAVGKKELVKKCKYAVEEDLNAMKDEYQFDIFLGDQSGQLLVLRAESILDNLPPTVFEIGSTLCFKNALYTGFDSHLGVHFASSTESTEWITKAPSPTANPTLKSKREEILAWTQTDEYAETMELLSSLIVDIRSNRASKAVPSANLANAVFRKSLAATKPQTPLNL